MKKQKNIAHNRCNDVCSAELEVRIFYTTSSGITDLDVHVWKHKEAKGQRWDGDLRSWFKTVRFKGG